jgi:hypothetical protein
MLRFLQEMWVRFLCWVLGMKLKIEVTPTQKDIEEYERSKKLEELLLILGCENEMKFDEAMRYYLCHGEADPKCGWLKRK